MKIFNSIQILVIVLFASTTTFGTARVAIAESVAAKENLEKLIVTRACRDCNLAGLNMNRLDLAGVDLQGADLSMSSFQLANLSGANLQGTILRGAQFGGTDLGNADLRGADLRGVKLDGAYLGGAKLDGKFVATQPYADLGIDGVEKQVYVDDPAKPKESPEAAKAVTIKQRRDFEEPPPQLAEVPSKSAALPAVKPLEAPAVATMTAAPAEKRVKPFGQVEIPVEDKKQVSVPAGKDQPARTEKIEVASADALVNKELAKADAEPQEKTPSPQSVEEVKTEMETVSAAALAEDKKKRDNLSRLLDSKRCYGCDLSGSDLSNKRLKKADLEKADLRHCNLREADLEGANLKGAQLQGADLRGADLRDADMYKANLSDADLTDARMKGAMLDNAETTNTKGLPMAPQ
jgi:uncharacterized protein YjbI with pentapeptide repeats